MLMSFHLIIIYPLILNPCPLSLLQHLVSFTYDYDGYDFGSSKADLLAAQVHNDASLYYLGVWVTTPALPIPSAIWLPGSGLIGIVGIRRKLKI
jgi:hypothetical protein